MSQSYSYPSSSTVSVSAIGGNGAPAPTTSIQIAGQDPSGDLIPVLVDSNGAIQIQEISPITGFALETTQLQVLSELQSIDGHIPQLAIGSQLIAASLSVAIASNQVVPISASALPLPSGAATEATLAAMSAKLPAALGAQVIAGSMAVNIASDQVVPVSAASLPLPSGAATAANQATEIASLASIDGKLPATLGQKAMASSLAVVIASDQSTVPVSAASLPLPSGAATEATLSALNAKVANDYGAASGAVRTAAQVGNASGVADFNLGNTGTQTLRVSANAAFAGTAASVNSGAADTGTQRVILASNSPGVSGRSKANNSAYNDYSSVNVTTGAYVQLVASTTSATNLLQVFDSSGQTIILAVGAAASEVDQCFIFPGGQGDIPLAIPAGSRVSIKAQTATANSGYIAINFLT